MSKSYKPKDDNYIDSTGIVHDRKLLSEILVPATQSKDGLMSSTDKTKLDRILYKTGNGDSVDLNSLDDGIRIINGWSGSISNKPSGCAWGILIQNSNPNGSNKVQVLIGLNQSYKGSVYVRQMDSNTWNGWQTIT